MASAGRRLLSAAAAATLLCLPACRKETKSAVDNAVTVRVQKRDIVESVSEDGVLVASRLVAVLPEADKARLKAIRVREGDMVKKGDILYEFDADPVDKEIEALTAAIDSSRLRLNYLRERRDGVEKLEARQMIMKAEQERREDERQLGIQKQLSDLGLAAPAEKEKLQSKAESSNLGLDLAKSRSRELEKYPESPEMVELKNRLMELENRLKEYRQVKEKLVGTAPFDGRIIMVDEMARNLADPSGELPFRIQTGRGPLLTIADVSLMKVIISFFESDIARISMGQKVLVTAQHVPGRVFEGKVAKLGEFGNARGQTATLPVEVSVDNRENLLKPGLTAEVRVIIAEKKGVPAVPVEFIRHTGEGTSVLRLAGDGARQFVGVKTGISDGRFVEVLSDLRENDVLALE